MKALADISLAENDRKAVESAAALLRERFPVEQVILFGSKARGDDWAESDIDLLILTHYPMNDEDNKQMTDVLFDLQLELGVVISKLVVSVDEWEHGLYQVLPIKKAIEQEGVTA